MTDLRKAAEMALEYLEYLNELDIAGLDHEVHTNALRQALAQPEQEPMCWITPDGEGWRMRFDPPINDVPMGWTKLYALGDEK